MLTREKTLIPFPVLSIIKLLLLILLFCFLSMSFAQAQHCSLDRLGIIVLELNNEQTRKEIEDLPVFIHYPGAHRAKKNTLFFLPNPNSSPPGGGLNLHLENHIDFCRG